MRGPKRRAGVVGLPCLTAVTALVAVSGALAHPAAACSGSQLTADVAIERANWIALVKLEATDGAVPAGSYRYLVEESLKGTIDRNLRTEPLIAHQCGDSINGPVESRFVIAFDVPTDWGQLLNPYWVVAPDGRLSPLGIDDTTDSATIDDLRGAIEARLGALGSIIPDDATTRPVDLRIAIVSVGVVLAGVGALFGTMVLLRRRARA